jgi:hypothetical protein
LTLTVLPPGLAWSIRVPHATQNVHSSKFPLSVARRHVRTFPSRRMNASAGTMTDTPKADADCF